jgi:hypothetical protein
MYIKETLNDDGSIASVKEVARPKWRYDDGSPVTDEYLAGEGYYPVVDVQPQVDYTAQRIERNPVSEWVKEEWEVVVEIPVIEPEIVEMEELTEPVEMDGEPEIVEIEEPEPQVIKMGKYIVTYTVTDLPLEDAAEILYSRAKQVIEAEFSEAINRPLPLTIGGKQLSMPLSQNDLLIYTAYRLRAVSDSTAMFVFRDTANAIHQLTAAEIVEITDQIDAFVGSVHMKKWASKDALTAAYAKVKVDGDLLAFKEVCNG